jgi:hypothetical protein
MGCGQSSEVAAPRPNRGSGVGAAGRNNRINQVQAGMGESRLLRKAKPWVPSKPISREGLALKREEFWSTRCTGHQQVWDAIKVASELLVNNDADMANTILQAAQVTSPNGSLAVCYDALGQKYEVDVYCYSDPRSFQEGHQEKTDGAAGAGEGVAGDPGREITIRMRLYVREIELSVGTHEFESVGKLKEILSKATADWEAPEGGTIPEQFPVSPEKMRFFANGYEMFEQNSISTYGVSENSVVQVMVQEG